MTVSEVEAHPQIQSASAVLTGLEQRGLRQAAIASGWTRAFLTDTKPSDIDVSYVGTVHYLEARQHLKEVLAEQGVDPTDWDIEGIWNAELMYPEVKWIKQNFQRYYVSSIDSVYLAADGKLHDTTGYGFADAATKTLRLNDYPDPVYPYSLRDQVYFLLEGCRRIAKLGWFPTEESAYRIKEGIPLWSMLNEEDYAYFKRRVGKKYQVEERPEAKAIYEQYGWGFVFDML